MIPFTATSVEKPFATDFRMFVVGTFRRVRGELRFREFSHDLNKLLILLAHPTRFECVTFAFGGVALYPAELRAQCLAVQRPNESNPLGVCCDIVKPVFPALSYDDTAPGDTITYARRPV